MRAAWCPPLRLEPHAGEHALSYLARLGVRNGEWNAARFAADILLEHATSNGIVSDGEALLGAERRAGTIDMSAASRLLGVAHPRATRLLGRRDLLPRGRRRSVGAVLEVAAVEAVAAQRRRRLDLEVASPAVAMRHGMAFLTEDRKDTGCFLQLSITENMQMAVIRDRFGTGGFVRQSAVDRECAEMSKAMRVKTPDLDERIENLSGGNQQSLQSHRSTCWLFDTRDDVPAFLATIADGVAEISAPDRRLLRAMASRVRAIEPMNGRELERVMSVPWQLLTSFVEGGRSFRAAAELARERTRYALIQMRTAASLMAARKLSGRRS